MKLPRRPSTKVGRYKTDNFTVSLQLPHLAKLSGTWVPDEREREAAWEMYVELSTRAAIVDLGPDEGFLREALTSLYSLFQTTRQILKDKGPTVAQPKGEGDVSFGQIAVAVLNEALRPFLTKWHPLLLDYEALRPPGVSQLEHERQWDRANELRSELNTVRSVLIGYANKLAEVAEVAPLSPTGAEDPEPR